MELHCAHTGSSIFVGGDEGVHLFDIYSEVRDTVFIIRIYFKTLIIDSAGIKIQAMNMYR